MIRRGTFDANNRRTKNDMKRQIEVGQTFRRGGVRGKLWQVDEILVWPQGTHARLRRLDDPTTTHLVAVTAIADNDYVAVDQGS
jgi:hypothetical protein